MKFVVQVSEILSKDVIVEANNAEDAEKIASFWCRSGGIHFNKENFLDSVAECRRVATSGDEKYYEEVKEIWL